MNKKRIRKKLTKKYRLVLLNEDSFEERFSFKLTRMNVYVLGGIFSILLVSITVLLIAVTPIKQYIPGFSSIQLKRQATNLTIKADSLELRLKQYEKFTAVLKPVIKGEVPPEELANPLADITDYSLMASVNNDSLSTEIEKIQKYYDSIHQFNYAAQIENYKNQLSYKNKMLDTLVSELKEVNSKAYAGLDKWIKENEVTEDDLMTIEKTSSDSIFREKVESEYRYNLYDFENENVSLVFVAPVKGIVTDQFNIEKEHYAVDVAVKKESPVKAVSSGSVIFSGWTIDTGYVIILEHQSKYISVYKHNKNLYKKQGDFVTAGEVIASAGNSGMLTTGTHLHFELWHEGYPVDPLQFIDFE